MSFRIDDLLKDKISEKCEEKRTFDSGSFIDREEEKLPAKVKDEVINYKYRKPVEKEKCMSCLRSHFSDVSKNTFVSSYTGAARYWAVSPMVSQNKDKTYPCYISPEKGCTPTLYNHQILPINFSIYTEYSKRRNQVRFTASQTKALEHKFSWQKYLRPEDRKLLAYSLNLSDRQVKTWFQNRRAKWRRICGVSSGDNNKMENTN